MDYNKAAFLTGFFGDAILQLINAMAPSGNFAGLNGYFEQHGSAESLFIAGGMLYFFGIAMDFLGIQKTILNLIIVGAILDVLFRFLKIFTSLDGYYAALSIPLSMIWGSIPMVLPLLLLKITKNE